MNRLRTIGVANATYGRAAKLIAVYLKAMVVTGPGSKTALARVAHPPIDRILLKNICQAGHLESPHKKEWGVVNWSKLDAKGYYRLIGQLRVCLKDGEPMWMLEKYWTVTSGRALPDGDAATSVTPARGTGSGCS